MKSIIIFIVLLSVVPMFAVANTTNVPSTNIVQLYKTTEVVEKVNQFYDDSMDRILVVVSIVMGGTILFAALILGGIQFGVYKLSEKKAEELIEKTKILETKSNTFEEKTTKMEKQFQSDYTKLNDLQFNLTRQIFYQIEMNIFSTLSQLEFEKEAATSQNMKNTFEKYADIFITQMKSGVDFLKEIIDYADIYKNNESEWLAYDMTCILFDAFWEPLGHIMTVPKYVISKRKEDVVHIYEAIKSIEPFTNTLGKSDLSRHVFEKFYKHLKIFMDNSGIKRES